ncbi:MAG: accessory factor UbiK family protein [Chromatiales bacterium]|nr:MAG: accessory factor UbiK family protein [Chromatiales bacterium]
MDKQNIDALARRLAESVPAGIGAVREDLSRNFAGVLASGLERLDLVTREEFDVQRKVLERTRARLEALEAELQQLEQARVTDPDTGT